MPLKTDLIDYSSACKFVSKIKYVNILFYPFTCRVFSLDFMMYSHSEIVLFR